MPTSQVRVRHVFVLTAYRRADLAGRPSCNVHPTVSMTLWHVCAYVRVRELGCGCGNSLTDPRRT
jgi:hypothetical protein